MSVCEECGSGLLDGEHIAAYPCSQRNMKTIPTQNAISRDPHIIYVVEFEGSKGWEVEYEGTDLMHALTHLNDSKSNGEICNTRLTIIRNA